MAEIAGSLDAGPPEPCVWCGDATPNRADAPGLVEPVRLPIHVLCAAAVIVAYNRFRAGRTLTGDQRTRMLGYVAAIEARTSGPRTTT